MDIASVYSTIPRAYQELSFIYMVNWIESRVAQLLSSACLTLAVWLKNGVCVCGFIAFGEMASSSGISPSERGRHPDASGDEGSPVSSSNERTEKSGKYSLDGLAVSWDDEPLIRNRMRNNENLMRHWDSKKGEETNDDVTRNVANLKLNYKVLAPLLVKMASNGHLLPAIDRIMEEVGKLLVRCKVPHDGERIYREGWAIKKLLSLAKAQMWKDRTPKDFGIWVFMFVI